MPKPRIMFYTDGRHPLIYMYEPPMQKEEYVSAVDELVGTPVEALMFSLGEGRTMLHDTKVGELLGHNIEKWEHQIFRRAHQNAKHLIEEGNDPLRIVCERAHEKGMLLYPTLLVENPGGDWVPMRASNFRKNNPQFDIGGAGDLDPDHPAYGFLDFNHEESREERFAIVEEALTEYPVDGFELQLNYQNPHYFHPAQVEAGRQIMTEWVGRVHETVKRSGKERELVIRIPNSVEACLSLGLDPLGWIKLGIVDVLAAEGVEGGYLNPETDFRPFVEAARSSNCRVQAVLHTRIDSDRVGDATVESVRAAACNYWAQDVDGLYLAQWFVEWPYRTAFYEKLRELPHPDIMAAKDKVYHILTMTSSGEVRSRATGLGSKVQLPAAMEIGRPIALEFTISDDLPRWSEVGRVHEVLLRVGISGTTERDTFSFRLDGTELPTSILRKINQMYRMSGPKSRTGPTYWFIFRLDQDRWPRQGKNTLEVTLLTRVPDLTPPISVRDLELQVKYLMAKNFHRGLVDPDLGPYEHLTW